ncbi:MAG: glycosyltransferase family 2 protein [Acidimicrobiia bacterium]|nr:glycosyltransferase family 2 protein [Acidimicrobiia bacterium]
MTEALGPSGDDAQLRVVAVTYNSAALLPDFFAALAPAVTAVGGAEVVIADNASNDGSAELAARLYPGASVVSEPSNRGYAAGINAALAATRSGGPIVILNPDVRLEPDTLDRLARGLRDTGAGIVVPVIRDDDGHLEWSLRREPSVVRAFGEALLGGDRAGRLGVGEYIADERAYERRTRADWATGAALMISSDCADELGRWDESFFLYSEETDYMLRARDAGFPTCLVPDALVRHLGGEMGTSPSLWRLVVENRLRLFRRRNSTPATVGFYLALVLKELTRSARGERTARQALRNLLGPSGRRMLRRQEAWSAGTPPDIGSTGP